MSDLLIPLGKRIQELRAAKKWSQEEFAHVSGFHRTYVGQIERGEKNISFNNLTKIAGAFGVTMAELFAELEAGSSTAAQPADKPAHGRKSATDPAHRIFAIQKLARQLKVQHAAMDRTVAALENLAASPEVRPGRSAIANQPEKKAR